MKYLFIFKSIKGNESKQPSKKLTKHALWNADYETTLIIKALHQSFIQSDISKPDLDDSNFTGDGFMMESILKASQEQNRIITIMYQSGKEITKRNIRVIDMDESKIKAMCYLRHQPRIFRKDCILAADYCRNKAALMNDKGTKAKCH